ncbi:Fic family protein [Engelhardtia mirabilis]|uniref:Adenosine monophosphate-protein transferase SoFic n=1 Tax=Engelhardtia mirabilis TaxID=2528011 RepID=A0A518BDQ9_9BACT|nr:Adenosine monophosphate-protein transferase SoFic [Planctomycetes bacterium Pla133]QDU99418.1 Adenosine monophosphate-protein transferase SoFic [Planctomycetes bacterium Pla86]
MAEHLQLRWEPHHDGLSRRDRAGGFYDAYLPDPLAGWDLTIPADVAADIADAEAAVRALNQRGTTHVSLEGLARFLLRAESVGSSRIEGLAAASGRLARAETALALGGDPRDRVAVEILGNIDAMDSAITLASEAPSFGLEEQLEVHRVLMERSPTPELGGQVRAVQNWIGGSSYNPCSAAFVPPPPERLAPLLDDLFAYVDGDDHSPLVQAAIAHAQFETLHPFADGNGRAGRALIHVVLRRRGLAPGFVPPISLVLATWPDDYVAGLSAFRHVGPRGGPGRSAGAVDWLRTFATATRRACTDAERYGDQLTELTARWRETLGRVRANSATDRLLRVLPGVPILTVESASRLVGRTRPRTAEAINRLVDAGILEQRNIGRERYRVFEAREILELFTGLERALASPVGDTRLEPPNRPVPRRPR